ncbi:MAG: hypothetical protein R3A13_03415 [Bdellovibrionota bacterium]
MVRMEEIEQSRRICEQAMTSYGWSDLC